MNSHGAISCQARMGNLETPRRRSRRWPEEPRAGPEIRPAGGQHAAAFGGGDGRREHHDQPEQQQRRPTRSAGRVEARGLAEGLHQAIDGAAGHRRGVPAGGRKNRMAAASFMRGGLPAGASPRR